MKRTSWFSRIFGTNTLVHVCVIAALVILVGLLVTRLASRSAEDQQQSASAVGVAPLPDDATGGATATYEPTGAEERMASAMADEPKVKDYIYDPAAGVILQVAVYDDGTSRDGLAGYFCLLLKEQRAATPSARVRIVDFARLREVNGAFDQAQLGMANCWED